MNLSNAICLLLVLVTRLSFAGTENLNLKNYEVAFSTIQQSSGESYSGMVGFAPQYLINSQFDLVGKLQAGPHKLSGEKIFTAFHALIGLQYKINEKWALSGLLGARHWTCSGCNTDSVMGLETKYFMPIAIYNLNLKGFSLQFLKDNRSSSSQTWNAGVFFEI